MPAANDNSALLDALAHLEKSLETPIIPGEVELWIDDLQKATEKVAPLLVQAVEKDHPDRLSDISDEDASLFRQVTKLKEDDQESLKKLDAFYQRLSSLTEHAGHFEPDEFRIEDKLEELTQQGLDLVIHIRKQEVALETWLTEALERDRGVVD